MPDPEKTQGPSPPAPDGLPADVIVSPDARRVDRVPPGQTRTAKWPVLDAHGTAHVDRASWRFVLGGLVESPLALGWEEYLDLPRVRVFGDFHCVTTWSRLGNLWEGVSIRELLAHARPRPDARFAVVSGADRGWTTNLPLVDLDQPDALLAHLHDGEPLTADHGGPVRLVVPRLYAWKSAKWVTGIELVAEDRLGFWEKAGYHERGDPWQEERYRLGPGR